MPRFYPDNALLNCQGFLLRGLPSACSSGNLFVLSGSTRPASGKGLEKLQMI
jgi:hypothetical protein